VPVLGTSPDATDIAEDRERFEELADKLASRSRPMGSPLSRRGHRGSPQRIGYRSGCGRSYVSAAARWRIVYDDGFAGVITSSKRRRVRAGQPRLLIRPLPGDAFEADVDAIAEWERAALIAGVMQQHRGAGVHSATRLRDAALFDRRSSGGNEMRHHTQAFGKAASAWWG